MKLFSLVSALLISGNALAATGFVTPSELTITFTEVSVIKTDNKNITLLSGSFPITFHATDSDFTAVSMGAITAPEGRFNGVRICYNTERTVKLNGDIYHGHSTGGLTDGTSTLYSTGSVATTNGSITDTAPGTVTTMTGYTVGNGTNNCSDSYFATPVCVSTDVGHCEAGDTRVDPGTTVPNVNIMLDLFNSVAVDASTFSLDNHVPVYPYPTIGRPGAAIHMTSPGTGIDLGNISLLFGNDKKLVYAAAYQTGDVRGFCNGNGFVSVSAAPAGAVLNSFGPTPVLTCSAAGKVQFAAGNAGTGTTSVSGGMVTIANALLPVTSNPVVTCVADSAADPAYLGYTYTTGAGDARVSNTWTTQKVIDPANLFSICSPGPSCGTY